MLDQRWLSTPSDIDNLPDDDLNPESPPAGPPPPSPLMRAYVSRWPTSGRLAQEPNETAEIDGLM